MIYLFLTSMALLAFQCEQLTLEEYAQLEIKRPEALFQHLDLPLTHNYPALPKLVFLTPWNRKGFQLAVKYSAKIDFISPCWYSLQLNQRSQPIFQNQHNYDSSFMDAISATRLKPKIVPRVYIEGSQTDFFQAIGSSQTHFKRAVRLIIQLMAEKNFDGIVWDTPFNYFERSRVSLNSLIVDFIKAIRERLPREKLIFFNMANPLGHMQSLDLDNYNQLPINYLLIQNYDKRTNYLTMIQKSIQWKSLVLHEVPLFLMMPFFSVKQNNYEPISSEAAADTLKIGIKSFRVSQGMCLYGSLSQQRFYIPCYQYFKAAFELAQRAEAGVGFWEGGNGLENYYKFL